MLIYEASRTLPIEQVPIHTPVARTTAIRLVEPAAAGAGAARRAGHGRPGARADPGGADGLRRAGPRRGDPAADPLHGVAAGVAGRAGRCTCSTRCWRPAARWCTRSSCSSAAARPTSRRSARWPRPRAWSTLAAANLPVRVVTASVDERLNDSGYIVPGWATRGIGSSAPCDRIRPGRSSPPNLVHPQRQMSRITSSGIGCSTENRIVPLDSSNPSSRSASASITARAERKQAEVLLRRDEPDERPTGVLERRHPVARALLGVGYLRADDVADVLEGRTSRLLDPGQYSSMADIRRISASTWYDRRLRRV